MNSDFIEPEKARYRDDLVAFIRSSKSNVDAKGRISGKWCELSGQSGPTSVRQLELSGVITAEQFIGIDRDEATVAENQHSRPDVAWIHGELSSVLPGIENISVLNLDGYYQTAGRLITMELKVVHEIAARSVKKFGAFVLLMNTDLDAARRRCIKPSEAIRSHTEQVCKWMSGWLPFRSLNPEYILKDVDLSPLDKDGVGNFGKHYHIYRGRAHRMASLKLILR